MTNKNTSPRRAGAPRGKRRATLCWTCSQGPRSGCPWFAEHRPVPGWTAERRDIPIQLWDGRRQVCEKAESYRVKACPLYRPDPPRRKRNGAIRRNTETPLTSHSRRSEAARPSPAASPWRRRPGF